MRGYLPAKETGRMSMAEKKDNVTSKFKDNVFCMLYRDKKNLLELYNALNNSAYTNVDDLQVTTLNGGSYVKYKNDASFLLCMSLYMFEQQSSKNPNMPLRFLHYVSDVFRELFSNSMLHRRSMIKIPVPHFVTFYNGLEKWVEDEDILVDFFEKHREEVVEVSIYDYDEEEVRRVLAEEYAQEVAQGMAQEIVEKAAKEASEKAFAEGEQSMMINQIIKKVKKSKTLETIASELEEEVADIKPIYDVVIAAAPDYNIDIIKNKLAIN